MSILAQPITRTIAALTLVWGIPIDDDVRGRLLKGKLYAALMERIVLLLQQKKEDRT
jgi:hypothetical protein